MECSLPGGKPKPGPLGLDSLLGTRITPIQNWNNRIEESWNDFINPAIKLVIPAAAERRAGIQKRPYDYWIAAFAGMTE